MTTDGYGVTRTEFSLLELGGDHGIMIVGGYASGCLHPIPSQLVGSSQHSIKSYCHPGLVIDGGTIVLPVPGWMM